MAKQNSVNLDITNNADGFDIAGGTTSRKLTVSGADISLTGSGSATLTFPTTTGTVALVPGSDTQVAFNDGGSALGGDAGLTYNKTTDTLTVAGDIAVNGGDLTTTSGVATLFNSNTTTLSLGGSAGTLNVGYDSTGTSISNISTGAVGNGNTKTVNIGTGGASGSTSNINLGSGNGGTVTVNKDLVVTGNLTVNGTTATINSTTMTVDDPIITLGGDTAPGSDDNKDRGVEFRWHNGSVAKVGFFGYDDSIGRFTFIPDATNTAEVFSGTQGSIDVNDIYINGTASTGSGAVVRATSPTVSTSIVAGGASFDLINTTATTVNFAGAGTAVSIGAATGTTTINNASTVVTGDLAVNGADITTTSTGTATVFNTNATTVNIAGAGTSVSIGAATGTTTINNANTVVTGDLAVNGADITTTSTGTANLFNTNATGVYVGGVATDVRIGKTDNTGTSRICGTVNVNGGALTTSAASSSLFDTTATVLDIGGAATTLTVGHDGTSASTTNIATGATGSGSTKAVNLGTGAAAGSTTNVNIGSSNGGTTTINSATVVGSAATQALYNTTATTMNFAGASTTLTMGATTGTAAVRNPTTRLGNTTSTITTNVGSTNSITISPYGNVVISPTTNPASDGDFATVTVTNTQGGGQVQVTGADLYLGNRSDGFSTYTSTIIFEGATADAYETTITPAEPTADQTITLPDASGTVGVMASPTNQQIQFYDSATKNLKGDADLTFDGTNLTIGSQGDIRLGDADSSNYVAFQAPATVAANNIYTLPSAVGSANQVLQIASVAGNDATLQWATVSGGSGTPGGSDTYVQFNDGGSTFGGDAGLTYNKTTDSLTVTGDLAVNGSDITTSGSGTATLFNTNALTLNLGGAATAITMGDATTATATIRGGTLVGNTATQSLFNTTATTLNVGGAATTVSIGAATGTTTINNANTVVTGDLAVNGGDITSTSTTFNLLNGTVTTLNLGTTAMTTVNIGTNANGAAVNLCNGNIVFSRTGAGMTYYSNLTDGSADGMNIKCNPVGSPIQIGDTDGANNTTILMVDDSSAAITFYTGTGSYTFPGSNGTSGQVLFTNGSGTLAWGDVAAGVGLNVSTTASSATVNLDDVFLFGDGADGDVTVTGSTTLTRDMFYNNLTINSSGSINTAGFRIYVKGTLDITAAAANSIQRNGTAGNTAVSTTGAAAVTALSSGSVGSDTGSGAGGNGGATTGTQGSAPTASTVSNGGQNGASGKGGNGTSGNGGALRAATTPTTCPINRIEHNLIRGITLINGGICGAGGSGGGGDGTAGGGGGSGGLGGGVVFVSAKTISRGASTATGCISANGGSGGGGFQPAAGNRGGGGGGSGGGGGWIYLMYGSLSGTSATNAIRASGGTGGNGANGSGTGTAGDGGTGAGGGRIVVINMGTGALTSTVGTTGTANTGTAGGAGETLQVSI